MSVGIAVGESLDGRGSIPGRVKFFSLHKVLEPTQPPIQWIVAAVSSVVKQRRRETNYSPPSSAHVRNGGAIPPLRLTSSWHGDFIYYYYYWWGDAESLGICSSP
jgi:hypothetical protein